MNFTNKRSLGEDGQLEYHERGHFMSFVSEKKIFSFYQKLLPTSNFDLATTKVSADN